ncbi:MAG TPA: L,D-transpeptidase [Anaerolineaceae bacterium]|nr:L,D-transpeptidase [Anaerolineaceae bacterium]
MDLGSKNYSRREFLRTTAQGVAGLFILPFKDLSTSHLTSRKRIETPPTHGRVISPRVDVYESPSIKSKLINTLWQDHVHPIKTVTVGDDDPPYNRIWYQLGENGYVHSGNIQPVSIITNPDVSEISQEGRLAEITVPFTNAVWHPNSLHLITYRLYYGSVFWVKSATRDKENKLWYKIADDKWKIHYYVEATHMHLFEPEELLPITPEIPSNQKKIEVRLKEQVVIAYEYSRPVFFAKTATGARFIDGDYRTQPGIYITNRKRPSRHMAAGDPAAPNSYDLPGIPWVTYLTENGVSFHGTYWHNDYGSPRSHGCINLTSYDAQWIFRWSTPFVPFSKETYQEKTGTIVEIF